jgi:hypothetical protein
MVRVGLAYLLGRTSNIIDSYRAGDSVFLWDCRRQFNGPLAGDENREPTRPEGYRLALDELGRLAERRGKSFFLDKLAFSLGKYLG